MKSMVMGFWKKIRTIIRVHYYAIIGGILAIGWAAVSISLQSGLDSAAVHYADTKKLQLDEAVFTISYPAKVKHESFGSSSLPFSIRLADTLPRGMILTGPYTITIRDDGNLLLFDYEDKPALSEFVVNRKDEKNNSIVLYLHPVPDRDIFGKEAVITVAVCCNRQGESVWKDLTIGLEGTFETFGRYVINRILAQTTVFVGLISPFIGWVVDNERKKRKDKIEAVNSAIDTDPFLALRRYNKLNDDYGEFWLWNSSQQEFEQVGSRLEQAEKQIWSRVNTAFLEKDWLNACEALRNLQLFHTNRLKQRNGRAGYTTKDAQSPSDICGIVLRCIDSLAGGRQLEISNLPVVVKSAAKLDEKYGFEVREITVRLLLGWYAKITAETDASKKQSMEDEFFTQLEAAGYHGYLNEKRLDTIKIRLLTFHDAVSKPEDASLFETIERKLLEYCRGKMPEREVLCEPENWMQIKACALGLIHSPQFYDLRVLTKFFEAENHKETQPKFYILSSYPLSVSLEKDLEHLILRALAHHSAQTWFQRLPQHPEFYLLLEDSYQSRLAEFLLWHAGDPATVELWLRQNQPQSEDGRLRSVFNQINDAVKSLKAKRPSPKQILDWVSIRPKGFQQTMIMIPLKGSAYDFNEKIVSQLVELMPYLEERDIVVKLLEHRATRPNYTGFPIYPLRWSSSALLTSLGKILQDAQGNVSSGPVSMSSLLLRPVSGFDVDLQLASTSAGSMYQLLKLTHTIFVRHLERREKCDPLVPEYLDPEDLDAVLGPV